NAYSAVLFLNDVQDGVWNELKGKEPLIDVIRRQLQRNYLDHLRNELMPKESTVSALPGRERGPMPPDELPILGRASSKSTDFRAVARDALHELDARILEALKRTKDPMTRVHLRDCRREIEDILKGKAGTKEEE